MFVTGGRQISVEPLKLRKAAAKDNYLRIKQIDDTGQRPSKPPFVALHRCLAQRVTGTRPTINIFRRKSLAAMPQMIAG